MKQLAIALIAIFAISCASLPECVDSRQSDLTIRWGQESEQMDFAMGYELNTDRELYFIQRSEGEETYTKEYLTTISDEDFCPAYGHVTKCILMAGALNVPSDPAHFIEFRSRKSNVDFRAVWNPKHLNAGNQSFHQLFDSLMALVPEDKLLKNK